MEKTWEDFWGSGKVTDYLAYKAVVSEKETTRKKETNDGTVRDSHGDGFDSHAY